MPRCLMDMIWTPYGPGSGCVRNAFFRVSQSSSSASSDDLVTVSAMILVGILIVSAGIFRLAAR